MIYKHTLTVSKLTDSTGGRRVYGAGGTSYPCHIEPIDVITAQATGYSLEKTFTAYIENPDTTITVSDKVTDQDSNDYTVKGIKRYNLAGSVSHAEAVLEAV